MVATMGASNDGNNAPGDCTVPTINTTVFDMYFFVIIFIVFVSIIQQLSLIEHGGSVLIRRNNLLSVSCSLFFVLFFLL